MSLKQEKAVILIIDSDPLMLTGMAAVLHMQDYECHCAQSSEAAMKAADTLELDLIICDVKLKHESGLALCKRLRNNGAEDVPVLYVSSAQQPDVIRRAHEAGGAYYLRKPFDPAVLIDLVDKALWLPHLVQSNIQAEGGQAPSAPEQSTEQTSEISITPLATSGDHVEGQRKRSGAPIPKSAIKASVANRRGANSKHHSDA